MNNYVSKGLVHRISNDISVDSTSGNSKHVGDMLVCLNDVRQPRNSWWMGFSWLLVLPLETVARTHTDETKNGRMKAFVLKPSIFSKVSKNEKQKQLHALFLLKYTYIYIYATPPPGDLLFRRCMRRKEQMRYTFCFVKKVRR